MSIPGTEAITRFQENEERLDTFLNSVGVYTTKLLTTVETIPSLMARIQTRYLNVVIKGNWVTATIYYVNDVVISSGVLYICPTYHVSGTFATDLAAGKWGIYQGTLDSDLIDVTSLLKGAGKVGYSSALAYGAGTVGKALNDLKLDPVIALDRTYYVRADGNDSNNGLANTAGGAFLTIQKAIDTVVSFTLLAQVTIQVINGSYTEYFVLKPWNGAITPKLLGNITTPANCVISTATNNPIIKQGGTGIDYLSTTTNVWAIGGFKLAHAASGYPLIQSEGINSKLFIIYPMEYGLAASSYHIYANEGATIKINGNYSITGNAVSHLRAAKQSKITVSSGTITVTGTITMTSFLLGELRSDITLWTSTYTGSVRGSKYSFTYRSDGSANGVTLPGSTAGTVATGASFY